MPSKNPHTRLVRTAVTAMLSAVAIVAALSLHFRMPPPVSFLEYDIADVPVLIISMIYGPLYGLPSLAIVSFLQAFLTPNGNQLWGFAMHFVSSALLVVISGLFHIHFRKWKFTFAGMAIGVVSVVVAMIFMNLTITVRFLEITMPWIENPRQMVIELMPLIAAFNFGKPLLNCIITVILYRALTPFIQKNTALLGIK